jgi:hypothetical protein
LMDAIINVWRFFERDRTPLSLSHGRPMIP